MFDFIRNLFEKKQPKNKEQKPKDFDDETPKSSDVVTFPYDEYAEYGYDAYWRNRINKVLIVDNTDSERYEEFDKMEKEIPEIKAALDLHTDYTIYPNAEDDSKMFKITSEEANIREKIEEIENRTGLQEKLYRMIRNMLKYGDNVEEIVTNVEGNRFMGFRWINIKTIVPVMDNGFPKTEPSMTQVIDDRVVATFNDTEVFHLSLNTDSERYSKFGKGMSILECSRMLYRQLKLMEEGMMITRLSRANQNYALIVDVGELQGDDALNYLDHFKKRVTRKKYYNPQTKQWNWEYNPLSVVEDIMVPTRQGSGGNVVPLNNTANVGKDIDDILYIQDKLIYSTGCPKLLIGKEVDVNSKSTSDNQVAAFLRRIRRIQTIITPQLKKLYQNVLRIEGFDVSLESLKVVFPSSTTVDEERKAAILRVQTEVARVLKIDLQAVDNMYIYTKVLGMSEREAEAYNEKIEQYKQDEEQKEIDKLKKMQSLGLLNTSSNSSTGSISGIAKKVGGNSGSSNAYNPNRPHSYKKSPSNKSGKMTGGSGTSTGSTSWGKEESYGEEVELTYDELLNVVKDKLTKEQYDSFMEHQKLINSDENLKSAVLELIEILKD